MLQRCGHLSEPVLGEIVLKKCLLISKYGAECFSLLVEQKRKLYEAFNALSGRIFKMSRYNSVQQVITYIESKPCDILLDEECFYYCCLVWKVFV